MDEQQQQDLRRNIGSSEMGQTISKYLSELPRDFFSLSVRGLAYALKHNGTPVGLPGARMFLEGLVSAGLGKPVKDPDGKISNVIKLTASTREIGAAVVGDLRKNFGRYNADRKERNIEGAAEAVKSAASELKIYPMRRASNISITVTINGYPVILPLPDDLKPDQLSALIERLKRVEDGYDPRKK